MDSQGYLWVCDTGNSRVQRVNPTTGAVHEIYDQIPYPYSIVVNDQYFFVGSTNSLSGGNDNKIFAYRRDNGMTTGIFLKLEIILLYFFEFDLFEFDVLFDFHY